MKTATKDLRLHLAETKNAQINNFSINKPESICPENGVEIIKRKPKIWSIKKLEFIDSPCFTNWLTKHKSANEVKEEMAELNVEKSSGYD